MAFAVGAPILWNMLLSCVKSVENSAKFRSPLNTYFNNIACPPELPGVSIRLMTTGIGY